MKIVGEIEPILILQLAAKLWSANVTDSVIIYICLYMCVMWHSDIWLKSA